MEIIIHGKPNAGSSKATPGIESALHERIVDEYFQSKSQLKISDALIVDARYWKNMWYSVYTYWLGTNVKDTADRPSFLAISIVVPKQYYCLVSEVYKQLKRVCENFVVGHYLSGNGKYLIQNFEDDTLFNNLIAKINDGFVNLQENFDASFKPQSTLNNNDFYNIVDCDSKAFVDAIKLKGRIIVTETAHTKDSFIANANKTIKQAEEQKNQYIQKTKEQQTALEAKTQTIAKLETEIADLKKQVTNSTNSTQQKIKDLEQRIALLNKEKNEVITKSQMIMQQNESLTNKLTDIAKIVGKVPSTPTVPVPPVPEVKTEWWKEYLPLLNAFLIIIVGAFIFFKPVKHPSDDNSKQIIVALQNEVKEKDKTITQLQASVTNCESNITTLTEQLAAAQNQSKQTLASATQVTTNANGKDIDCNLKIFQDNAPKSANEVDLSKLIFITYTHQEGYDFYVDNIINADSVKSCLRNSQPFRIRKAKPNKVVVISYRTDNRNNVNPQNKLTFN